MAVPNGLQVSKGVPGVGVGSDVIGEQIVGRLHVLAEGIASRFMPVELIRSMLRDRP